MGKGRDPDPPCCQKYGVPLYGAAWVPLKKIYDEKSKEDKQTEEVSGDGSSALTQTTTSTQNYLVFGGGGGEGRSGIPNAILLAEYDFASNTLSNQPVAKLGTGTDLPYRMAVHPGGEGLICSMPKSCRWLEWDMSESTENHKLGLKSSEKVGAKLEDVGQQLALAFNNDGSLLAVGGEDGYLRVFRWPTMELIVDKADTYTSVKDLDFSSDGKFLVSLGSGGPCRVWDVTSSTAVASLLKENDEVFGFCRFSQTSNGNQILYTTAMRGQGGSVVSWDTTSWERLGSKQIVRDPISAFNISADGKLLAIGTNQGDILIIDSSNMRVRMTVRKAHLLVTTLMFSQDSRALVSASFDSSARVTLVEEVKQESGGLWVIIFVVLLAVLAYLLKNKGAL